jgi:hypothetical protein
VFGYLWLEPEPERDELLPERDELLPLVLPDLLVPLLDLLALPEPFVLPDRDDVDDPDLDDDEPEPEL